MTLRAVPLSHQGRTPGTPDEADPLDAFGPEGVDALVPEGAHGPARVAPLGFEHQGDAAPDPSPRPLDSGRQQGVGLRTAFLLIGGLLSLIAGGIVAVQLQRGSISTTSAPRTGRLALETRPAGVQVEIDGQPRGATPLAVDLTVGTHTVRLRHEAEERTLSVNMTAGAQMSQYLELGPPKATAAPVGHLTIVSEPPGARVSINGEARGVTPVTVRDLEATPHKVTVVGATGSSERTVDVAPGGTTSVVFALGRPGVTAGYLSVQSAFTVQIAEGGDIVGSSAASRMMIAAGRHDMTFSNPELGFEDRRQVEIRPGATTTVRLDAVAALNINARPWAEVAVDGVALGQTPIANHSLPLGSHLVVFRHPDLGERRQTVVVTARGPNRISMDLTR